MVAVCLAVGSYSSNAESTKYYLWTAVLLLAVLAFAAVVIVWVGRWVRRSAPGARAGEELTNFRLLYERGELGREEYERIRAKLAPRLRQEMDLPPAPAKDTPASESVEPRSQAAEPPPETPSV
jgi:hypothetical protein